MYEKCVLNYKVLCKCGGVQNDGLSLLLFASYKARCPGLPLAALLELGFPVAGCPLHSATFSEWTEERIF